MAWEKRSPRTRRESPPNQPRYAGRPPGRSSPRRSPRRRGRSGRRRRSSGRSAGAGRGSGGRRPAAGRTRLRPGAEISASGSLPVPKVSTIREIGWADADRVGDLDLAAIRQVGGDDVLGDVARRVGRGAVDLGRVLAGEGAAAVARHPAVGVDDDLAAGEAGVADRAADHELAGRVDEEAVAQLALVEEAGEPRRRAPAARRAPRGRA